MHGSFHKVIDALSNSPEVAKASGISEERTLIIDMIERMIGDFGPLDDCTPREGAERIIASIRAELHRKDFDA